MDLFPFEELRLGCPFGCPFGSPLILLSEVTSFQVNFLTTKDGTMPILSIFNPLDLLLSF
jgi:hypothetical protein